MHSPDASNGPGSSPGIPDEATLLRLLAEAARDFAIFAVDGEGNILTWNPGVLTVTGYEEQEFIGQNCEMLFTPEDREQGAPEQERETARREGQALDERWHLKKDGTRFWGSGFMHALYDDNNHLKGFAKILRDMTAQKRYEQELEARVQERTTEAIAVQRRLLTAQEEAQRRISRELHDSTGQHLAALGIELSLVDQAAINTREAAAKTAKAASDAAHLASQAAQAAATAAAIAAQAETVPEAARLAGAAAEAARTAAIVSTNAAAAAAAANAAMTTLQDAAPGVARLRVLTDALSHDLHRLALDLRPTSLDDLGLMAAVRAYAESCAAARAGVEITVESIGLEEKGAEGRLHEGRLPSEVETTLYRVVQEALTNVAKHAVPGGATRASVMLQRMEGTEGREGYVQAIIEDDGPGFDPETAGAGRLGLVGMRERAASCGGTLEIETARGKGTSLYIRVPVKPD